MELLKDGGLFGQRAKYLMIVASTILPVIVLLFVVFLVFFLPVFSSMEREVDAGINQLRPLRRLEAALLRSVMPPNAYLVHSAESERLLWYGVKQELEDGFEDAVRAMVVPERRRTLENLRNQWGEAARRGDLLVLDQIDTIAGWELGKTVERFSHLIYGIADEVGHLIDVIEKERREQILIINNRIRMAVYWSMGALLLGLSIGVCSSLLLTRARKRIINLTMVDALTGVYSRRGLRHAIASAFSRQRTDLRISFAVLIMDIDHFKVVNDTYGHDVGDYALCRLAAIAGAKIRRRDIFGRYGGEEFVVFLPEAGIKEALALAERIRSGVEETAIEVLAKGTTFGMTVSIGCSAGIVGENTVEAVFKAADTALYQAKEGGRNRVVSG